MSIFTSILGDKSAKYFDEASEEYKKYSQQSLEEITRSRAEGRGDITAAREQALGYQKPYIGAGEESLQALLGSLGVGQGAKGEAGVYSKFTTSPGYQFALRQGQQTIQAANAARGLGGSGAEQMQLQQFGQGMGQQEWDKYLQNYQNRLTDLAGMGQKSAFGASDITTGAGRSLADLGLQYSSMDVGVLQSIAKSSAEAKMAKGTAEAGTTQAIWKGLGSVAGAAAGIWG